HARAYLLESLFPVELHVVNDMLGGVPVTITYCDQTDCLRVFTDPVGKQPLDMGVGGWVDDEDRGTFVLRVGTMLFRQNTGRPVGEIPGQIPYPQADFVRKTWHE